MEMDTNVLLGSVSASRSVTGMVSSSPFGISGTVEALKVIERTNAVIDYNTTDGWNQAADTIAQKGVVYVYSDYQTDKENNQIPGIKIGDGTSYLIDMPFATGITQKQIDFWNNKVSVYAVEDEKRIVFTTGEI